MPDIELAAAEKLDLRPTSKRSLELCLNIFVRNKKGLVKKQVSERLGMEPRDGPARVAAKMANHVVKAEQVAKLVADGVAKEMPIEMARNGVSVTNTLRFCRENYAVISVEIKGADFKRLASAGAVPHVLARVLESLSCCPFCESLALRFLFAGLLAELPEKVTQDLALRGGVEADVVAVPLDRQAEYMFDVLRDMEDRQASQANKLTRNRSSDGISTSKESQPPCLPPAPSGQSTNGTQHVHHSLQPMHALGGEIRRVVHKARQHSHRRSMSGGAVND